MPKFIPFPAYYDDVPIDLSFVYANEKPAGRHGFLRCVGDHFEFEDGTPGRFWGTNFNGGANFPAFDYSEKVARRLAKIGCNIVRFHQLDAEWDTPNIFAFTKGARVSTTTALDPESMKRLDYLIHCLKQEGIYVYFDMLTYRKFKAGDGFENAEQFVDASRQPYVIYNRRMIELQKDFMAAVWNHHNPYTGLAYKDDPTIAMSEIINECDLFSMCNFGVEPYTGEFRALFRKWLDERKIEFDAENCDLKSRDAPLGDFKYELQVAYYKELRDFERSIGVKVPIAGTNWCVCDQLTKSQLANDFTDGHTYFYDWRWNKHLSWTKSVADVADPSMAGLSRGRLADKPYFVSEWDMPWPNPRRAESTILFAAVGAYQNWAGFAIHTYAYGTRLNKMEILGKEISSPAINGVGYREGIFSTWNDPAKFGMFYHSALITRRADVVPSGKVVKIKAGQNKGEAYPAAAELCRIATDFEDGVDAGTPLVNPEAGMVRSVDGQLYRNWKDHYGTVDTPRTKAVYGKLAKNGMLKLNGLTLKCDNEFAVIAISSLSDAPLGETDNILLSAVGDAVNTDMKWEGEHLLDYGKPPILAEVVEAEIALQTNRKDLRIRAINPEGFIAGIVPATFEDGWIKFKIGAEHLSIYYLIQAE